MGPIRATRAVLLRNTLASVTIFAVAGLAAACSSSSNELSGIYCPDVAIVGDLSVMSRFGGPTAPPDQTAFYGEIVGASTQCGYDENMVEMAVQISMLFDRPPGGAESSEPVRYFVAVSRPDGTVIGKEEFDTAVDFRDGEIRAGYREEVDVAVPLPEGQGTGPDFSVFVGFQLTAAELEFNRQRQQ